MLIFDDTVSSSSPQPPSIVLLYNAGHYLKSDTVYLFCRLQVVLGLQKFLFFYPVNVAADERSRQMNMSLFKRCRPSFETGSVALSLSLSTVVRGRLNVWRVSVHDCQVKLQTLRT